MRRTRAFAGLIRYFHFTEGGSSLFWFNQVAALILISAEVKHVLVLPIESELLEEYMYKCQIDCKICWYSFVRYRQEEVHMILIPGLLSLHNTLLVILNFIIRKKSSLNKIYHFSSALINRIRLLTKCLLQGPGHIHLHRVYPRQCNPLRKTWFQFFTQLNQPLSTSHNFSYSLPLMFQTRFHLFHLWIKKARLDSWQLVIILKCKMV